MLYYVEGVPLDRQEFLFDFADIDVCEIQPGSQFVCSSLHHRTSVFRFKHYAYSKRHLSYVSERNVSEHYAH